MGGISQIRDGANINYTAVHEEILRLLRAYKYVTRQTALQKLKVSLSSFYRAMDLLLKEGVVFRHHKTVEEYKATRGGMQKVRKVFFSLKPPLPSERDPPSKSTEVRDRVLGMRSEGGAIKCYCKACGTLLFGGALEHYDTFRSVITKCHSCNAEVPHSRKHDKIKISLR